MFAAIPADAHILDAIDRLRIANDQRMADFAFGPDILHKTLRRPEAIKPLPCPYPWQRRVGAVVPQASRQCGAGGPFRSVTGLLEGAAQPGPASDRQ